MKTDNEISDEALLEALRSGSVEAFNIVYGRYAAGLLAYVAKGTGNKADAEEIVNDIFLGLWNVRQSLSPDTNLATYLFSIAYRRRIDFFRRKINAPVYEDYRQYVNEVCADDNNVLEYKDFLVILNKALSLMPPKLSRILVMSRIRGMANTVIADAMSISEKTVRNSISIGLKMLRERMAALKNNYES